MAQTLPYLSDRPHSFRYLQVETQQIAFLPLKDEIEVFFFCLVVRQDRCESVINTWYSNALVVFTRLCFVIHGFEGFFD